MSPLYPKKCAKSIKKNFGPLRKQFTSEEAMFAPKVILQK